MLLMIFCEMIDSGATPRASFVCLRGNELMKDISGDILKSSSSTGRSIIEGKLMTHHLNGGYIVILELGATFLLFPFGDIYKIRNIRCPD
jgi:hypothetical protein